jgi:hypothetical protein
MPAADGASGGFPSRLEQSLRRRRRRRSYTAQHRALELLAASADGCTEGIMRSQGFSIDFMVELVRSGLATATAEHIVSGPNTIEVARMRITDAGRRVLGER